MTSTFGKRSWLPWSLLALNLGAITEDPAYEYELGVGRHAEALEIAEFMWSQHDSDIALGPTWILSRAKYLVRLDLTTEAKALLLEHRNLYDSAAEVNRYLDKLRSSRA